MFGRTLLTLALATTLACGSSGAKDDEPSDQVGQRWDSAGGNPTHPTHSYMAEYAINELQGQFAELGMFRDDILAGVNLELHELPVKDEFNEKLRQEIGGNNWAADHPDLLWKKAQAAYGTNRRLAFFYVGILMHYVQDMGVPAHAFHVIHQSSFNHQDAIEVHAFFKFRFDADYTPPEDPGFHNPFAYIEYNGALARQHWNGSFPDRKYERLSFPMADSDMSDDQWKFLIERETQTTQVNVYALRAAASWIGAF